MKLSLPSIQMLVNATEQAIRRFPLPFLAAVVGTYACWALLDVYSERNRFEEIFMVSLLAVPSLIAVQIFGEARRLPKTNLFALLAVVVALLLGYWWLLDAKKNTFHELQLPRYFALLAVAHLSVTFAPFLHRREPTADFWEFNKQLFGNWLSGAFFGAVIFAGLAGALAAVDNLFELKIAYQNYGRLFSTIGGIFHPLYFLYHFPKNFEFESSQIKFSSTFSNLCKYILIPIVGLYFLILYAFSGKILFTWTLPQGWVSSLVLGFAGAGILTWLLNYMLPLRDAGSIVNNFRKWFWWILLPMIFLLFVAISRRILEYGITEPRFFVAHLSTWLLACAVFFIFIKSQDIKFIPLSLAVFLLIGVFGPFSAFEASKRSQKKELIKLLQSNDLWENDRAKPALPNQKVDEKALARIASITDFFIRRDDWAALQPILNFPNDSLADAQLVLKHLNLESTGIYFPAEFYVSSTENQPELDISGYQKALQVLAYPENQRIQQSNFQLSDDGLNLILEAENLPKQTFSLEKIAQVLRSKRSLGYEYQTKLDVNESVFELESNSHQLKIWVQNAQYAWEEDKAVFKNMQGFAFLKSK